jgi:dihydrolipoamide dehydrogenase
MGGTCLNRGCIPSKALLGSAHFLTLARHAALMGLEMAGPVKPNWAKMMARKDAIVDGFRKGVTGLVQSNKITIFAGRGVVSAPGKVRCRPEDAGIECRKSFWRPVRQCDPNLSV